jgi:hypothetical protein
VKTTHRRNNHNYSLNITHYFSENHIASSGPRPLPDGKYIAPHSQRAVKPIREASSSSYEISP